MKKVFHLVVLIMIASSSARSQNFNADPNKSFMNLNIPTTPESQGFEKYGKIPVSELTGSANVTVPIYNLKSRFLEVPISLSYNTSGIKVSQEATWVGLGFDLLFGGRITLEVKGNADGSAPWQTVNYRDGLKNIFHRLGDSSTNTILTYATTQWEWNDTLTSGNPNFYNYDDTKTVENMAWYGSGEPDIYHANFAGNSFSFYFDMVTDSLKFIGEKSLCSVTATRNNLASPITKWTVIDNKGIYYYFDQIENTVLTTPTDYSTFALNNNGYSWLLTKMVHPTGDSILFTYANYGTVFPAYAWNASLSAQQGSISVTASNDLIVNQFTQYPAYVTKIESNNTAVDFILSNRDDIKGAGARRLSEIRIRDKQTNTIKRKVQFSYGYFDGALESFHASVPDSISKYYHLRLKLNSLYLNDSTLFPPYKFYYNLTSMPEKYSFRQDHWGYYNAVNNSSVTYGSASPQSLVPKQSDLVTQKILSAAQSGPPDGTALSRKCDSFYCQTMVLDSLVYPTGGSTSFSFEPHVSAYFTPGANITGGGLRIKTIRNYGADGIKSGTTDYAYDGGVYMGAINYLSVQLNLIPCTGANCSQPYPLMNVMASGGDANASDMLVAYSKVQQTFRDELHQSNNGSIVKYFNIPQSYEVALNHSIDTRAAIWPVTFTQFGQTVTVNNSQGLVFINPIYYSLAPTPRKKLDGKLVQEQYLDNNNNLLKSVNYYYRQADYSQNLYSIKAKDNYSGGASFGESLVTGLSYNQLLLSGVRRFTMAVSPAKSFFTVTDSVVEVSYTGAASITQKKSYRYNAYFQPEYEITDNSDGSQKLQYTRTPLSFTVPPYPIAPVGDALALVNLRNNHIYDLSVEQMLIKKGVAGDSTVLGARYNLYNGPLISKSYVQESTNPLTLSSQFVPASYNYVYPGGTGNYSLKIDNSYVQRENADYTSSNLMQNYTGIKGNQSLIWDTIYNNIIAQCNNALASDIAYTSFETAATGNWNYSGTPVADATAITGGQSYSLASGNISRSGLNTTASYTISYWSKNGQYSVTGSASSFAGRTSNGWTYYEHLVTNPGSGLVTISGSGSIDELRLYPSNAMMTTYTYNQLIGIASQCDGNNRVSYYEYDGLNRLMHIKDQDKNILKKIEYKYLQNNVYPYSNTAQSVTYTRNNCAAGYAPTFSSTTTAAANTFGSFVSVPDANQQALNWLNLNYGQSYANQAGNCAPFYSFTACCNFVTPSTNFSLTGTGSVNFSIVLFKQGGTTAFGKIGTLSGLLFVPSQQRTVTATSGSNSWTLTFFTNGDVNIMGPNITTSIQLNGTYAL